LVEDFYRMDASYHNAIHRECECGKGIIQRREMMAIGRDVVLHANIEVNKALPLSVAVKSFA
jgi:hypothetical protein